MTLMKVGRHVEVTVQSIHREITREQQNVSSPTMERRETIISYFHLN